MQFSPRIIVSFARDDGDIGTALDYARQLAQFTPGDSRLTALIGNLQRQMDKPDAR